MYLMTEGLIMHWVGKKRRRLIMKSPVNLSNSELIAEETEPQNASNTQELFGGLGRLEWQGKSRFSKRPSGDNMWGYHPERGKDKETLGGGENRKRTIRPRWHHSSARWGDLRQRAPKDNSRLVSFMATGFIFSMVNKWWVQFLRVCKVGRV